MKIMVIKDHKNSYYNNLLNNNQLLREQFKLKIKIILKYDFVANYVKN